MLQGRTTDVYFDKQHKWLLEKKKCVICMIVCVSVIV